MAFGSPEIVVIGAGPTGLGAAWRLEELGHRRWRLFEAAPGPGGLAASVVDARGFTWDYGCHVFHSHYGYVDSLLDAVLGDDWIEHLRDTRVWLGGRWIPYPLQNNLWRLPREDVARCLDGLLEAALGDGSGPPARTFDDWLRASFGEGLHRLFMGPYNLKAWGYPPDELGVGWMKDRVAMVDVRRLIRNVVLQADETGWGPNARFRYPAHGGMGAVWCCLSERLPPKRMRFGCRVVAVDAARRTVHLEDGQQARYDYLISSMPLDRLLALTSGIPELRAYVGKFVRTSTHVVGLGFQGCMPPALRGLSWMYFPEPDTPFHRASVSSNYSPFNVPRPGVQWSLLAEISETPHRPIDGRRVVEDTLRGFCHCGLVNADATVVSRWHQRLEYGYPTPWLGRDAVLEPVNDALEAVGVLSRGRFGAWKYEVSNQDHAVMQGAEAVERVLRGGTEYTFRGQMRDSLAPARPPPPASSARVAGEQRERSMADT